MLSPPIPADEASRIAALRALRLLDTPPEERFDRLTRLARRLFAVPIALVSLVDSHRQWFKSVQGLPVAETPREVSFCGHAILVDEILLVPDASLDARFDDNPLVSGEPHIRFYAGCPLRSAEGARLGTLCVIDVVPRALGDDERMLLRDLARLAEQELAGPQLSSIDALTRLSSRRGFEALAQHALADCRRTRRPATLLCIDLDGLQSIDDRFGAAEGDRAIVDFANLLERSQQDADVIARTEGESFVVLLAGVDANGSRVAVDRLIDAAAAHDATVDRGYRLRFTTGAVEYVPARHTSVQAMLAEADALMHDGRPPRPPR